MDDQLNSSIQRKRFSRENTKTEKLEQQKRRRTIKKLKINKKIH